MREAIELEATDRTTDQGVLGAIGQKLGDYLVLSKARLSLLVLSSGLVGFWARLRFLSRPGEAEPLRVGRPARHRRRQRFQ